MGKTKEKLSGGATVYGGWIMMGHPAIAEIYAGEGFDFIVADMEHTSIDMACFYQLAMAVKGTGVDLLARLPSCDPVLAKRVLDAGADGIIVPNVNSPEEARLSVAMAKYPPEGIRGSSLCRATDYGRNFSAYFTEHNDKTLVLVMMEHIEAVKNADAILATPGIDAVFVGPYDLSASMGLAGQLKHPDVLDAQKKIVAACERAGVPAGLHVTQMEPETVAARRDEGFRFIVAGIDTHFIMHGCREMMKKVKVAP